MNDRVKQRIAKALRCKPSEVPEEPKALEAALDKKLKELKAAKAVKHG